MSEGRTTDVEDLIAQAVGLRRLAVRLVGESDADDVVQDAILAGMQHAPREESALRPWLARVVRNFASGRHRSAGHRAARESDAARGEALPSAAEMVERMEVQRIVAEEVLQLAEPYRRAVLALHFEGVSAEDYARGLGVPGATVRSWSKRGLDTLRTRLDKRFGGERSAWSACLLSLVRPEAALVPAIAGALILKKVLVTAAVLLTAFLVWKLIPEESPARWANGLAAPTDIDVSSNSNLGADSSNAAAAPRSPADEQRSEGEQLPVEPTNVTGRVVDESFGLPLIARVKSDIGDDVFSGYAAGAFALALDRREGTVIRAEAPGYSASEVRREPDESWPPLELRLRASTSAQVIVHTSKQTPVAGARVQWRAIRQELPIGNVANWIRAEPNSKARVIEATTDLSGVSKCDVGFDVSATIVDPRTGLEVTVRLSPSQERLIVLPDEGVELRFVDEATGTPLTGLALESLSPRELDATVVSLRTGNDGIARVLATSFPLLVRLSGPAVWERTLIPRSPGVSLAGFGGDPKPILRIEAMPDATIEVGVRPCGGRLRLIDDDTGSPIEGLVTIEIQDPERCPTDSGTRVTGCTVSAALDEHDFLSGLARAVSGFVPTTCALADAVARSSSSGSTHLIVVAARGYRPIRIPASAVPWNVADPDLELRLRPAQQRTLLVVDELGTAVRLPVAIYSPVGDVLYWTGNGSDDGLHGPFDWFGGDMHVRVGEGKDFPHRLTENELADSEIVHWTLPMATGAIVVEGIPEGTDGSRLIAKLGIGLSGTKYAPSALEHGQARFDGLPVGHYCVGPDTWVEGAERQSHQVARDSLDLVPSRSRVVVTAGSVSTITWSDAWECGTERSGRVTGNGNVRADLFLVPLYADVRSRVDEVAGTPPRMVFGRRSPRIPLDRDGTYSIGPRDPLPVLLVVCALDDTSWGSVQGLHVLETLLPGESVDVVTGSIELRDTGAARTTPIQVQYQVPLDSLRHPVSTFYEWSKSSWVPGSVLRLDGVPVHVRELQVGAGVLPIQLEAGAVERRDVDVRTLQPVPR